MTNVVPLRPRQPPRRRTGKTAYPVPMPLPHLKRLLELAAEDRLTFAQLRFGARTVKLWALGKGIQRNDWVMVVLNGMRTGWALRGYERWRKLRRFPVWYDQTLDVVDHTIVLQHIEANRERKAPPPHES